MKRDAQKRRRASTASSDKGKPAAPPAGPAPSDSPDDRRRRLDAAFLQLSAGEQAKLMDRAALRDAEQVLAGNILERARARFYSPITAGGASIGVPNAVAHVADTLARAGARDPVEEMLLTQMVWAHARVAHLTTLANRQDGLKQIQTISDAVERAHNTCRRLALALADYRRPPRQFIAARQFNQAGQQVVQNNAAAPPVPEAAPNEEKRSEKAANEKGLLVAPPQLPPDERGAGGAEKEHRAVEAVAADARAGDGGGEGALQPQRVEARRAER